MTPALPTARERRDAVTAALIPLVLLSIAGGQVLRHMNVRELQQPSVTFDPELWLPYRPPPLIDEWSGVLYPALRMRPLTSENTGGWLATVAVFAVLLAVLALVLRAVARRASRQRRSSTFMECWYATLLAAVAAALVEGVLLQDAAPHDRSADTAGAIGSTLAEAVRFGTVWGWATGAAFLGAVLLLSRRGHSAQPGPNLEEGRLSHAE